MAQKATWLIAVILIGCGTWYGTRPRGGQVSSAAPPATRPAGIAVVELFTSQGCSSCPPAERVLEDLTRAAAAPEGRPVFTLAFHVDYWNRLGWADPFSDAAYSRRQQQYAGSLHLDEVYTPQMIVNGREQFVGSDRRAADRAIGSALGDGRVATVTVSARGSARDGYRVHAAVTGGDANLVLNVAVVEQGLATDVRSGENGGRHLEEASVVRWFTSVPVLDGGNDVAVPPLPRVRAYRASVIAYAQRSDQRGIVGAASASLP